LPLQKSQLKGRGSLKLLIGVILGVCSLISNLATANEKNSFSYFGVAIQKSSFDDIQFQSTPEVIIIEPIKYKESTSGVGARIFTGFNFNEFIGIEAGLSQFAKPNFTVTEKITNTDKTTSTKTHHKGDFSTLGVDIRAIGSYSLTDDVFIRAQVGAVGWDNKHASLNMAEDKKVSVIEVKDRGISLLTGLGIGYGLSKGMAITLDFERTEVAEVSVKTLSLGFSFKL